MTDKTKLLLYQLPDEEGVIQVWFFPKWKQPL